MAGEAQTTDTTVATETTVADQSAVVTARPDYLPETYWDAEKNAPKAEDLTKDLTDLAALRTEKEARAASIIAKPEDVQIALPDDFQMPEGLEFKPDPNMPLFKEFQKFAAGRFTPDETKALVGLFARDLLNQSNAAEAARTEQMKALGANATTRVDAAQRWLNANVSEQQAKVLSYALGTKDGVEAVESIIEKLKGVKPAGLPGNTGLKDKADLSGLTPYEKLKAANAASSATH